MPLAVGDQAPEFKLTDTDGNVHELAKLRADGKRVWLAFFRYSACIMCQLRVNQLKQKHAALAAAGVVVLPVFCSTPKEIAGYVGKRTAGSGLSIIAEPGKAAYRDYGAGSSCLGSALGLGPCYHMCIDCAFWKAACYANCSCQHFPPSNALQMPADFLIGVDGKIERLHKGKTLGDHISFAAVEQWAGTVGTAAQTEIMDRGTTAVAAAE